MCLFNEWLSDNFLCSGILICTVLLQLAHSNSSHESQLLTFHNPICHRGLTVILTFFTISGLHIFNKCIMSCTISSQCIINQLKYSIYNTANDIHSSVSYMHKVHFGCFWIDYIVPASISSKQHWINHWITLADIQDICFKGLSHGYTMISRPTL